MGGVAGWRRLLAQGGGTFSIEQSDDQTTTRRLTPIGTIEGTVADASGGVIPGATVVLIGEANGARSVPGATNEFGGYSFGCVAPGTYTVEVSMPGFQPLRRAGVAVDVDERVAVPTLTLQVGGTVRNGPGLPALARRIISGDDIAFRPEYSPNTPAGTMAGRWMVRVNGQWLEAGSPVRAVPAR